MRLSGCSRARALSVLPVWVLRSAAPAWAAGAALAVNTVLVLLTQRGWAARLVDQVALQNVDPAAEARCQSAFSTSASGARILGPRVGLPLVLHVGSARWVLLTVVMGAACTR